MAVPSSCDLLGCCCCCVGLLGAAEVKSVSNAEATLTWLVPMQIGSLYLMAWGWSPSHLHICHGLYTSIAGWIVCLWYHAPEYRFLTTATTMLWL